MKTTAHTRPLMLCLMATAGLGLAAAPLTSSHAYDLTDSLSVSAVLAGAGQCQVLLEDGGADDGCGGALPFQPELSWRAWDSGEIFVKLGFAWGDGLNDDSPFELDTWAADLQNQVENVAGHWRYLLNAWVAQRFRFGDDAELLLSGGIIDATDYLDGNVYSNDEYTQFMNQGLVSGPNAFLPAHNPGGVARLELGKWSVTALGMWVGEFEGAEGFGFFGGQVEYALDTRFGPGNYRVLVTGSTDAYPDVGGIVGENRVAGGFSFDQAFGESFGAFVRLGWRTRDSAVNYGALYSGGIQVVGNAWGRETDTLGLGYAYLNEGNTGLESTHVVELYYRWVPHRFFELTADIQYMRDTYDDGSGPNGFVFGLRAVLPL